MKTSRPTLTLLAFAALLAFGTTASAQRDLDAEARAIHNRILVLDAHTDVLLDTTPDRYFAAGRTSRTDLDKLRRGGVGAVAFAIAVGPGPRTEEGTAAARVEADAKLAAIRAFLKAHPGDVAAATTAADIKRIRKAGKIAILTSFLNARSIGTDPSQIDRLYNDGVRLFGFTHAAHNDFADSSRPVDQPAEEHHGLSPFGKEAIARLNRLGVIIDVSQLSPAGVQQVIALSKAPVIASHSNVRSLVDAPRNLSDAELDAIKANGGVVHVTAFNAYLRPRPAGSDPALPAPRATVSDLVDHIDAIVKRIGIDHVGIGSDFNHGAGIDGFDDLSEAPNVTRELLRRGYRETQIAKIWGGNFLRVFQQVESTATTLKGRN